MELLVHSTFSVLFCMMEAHRIVVLLLTSLHNVHHCHRARNTDENMYDDQKCTNLSALFVQRSIFMFIFNTGDSWNILPVRWQQYGPVRIRYKVLYSRVWQKQLRGIVPECINRAPTLFLWVQNVFAYIACVYAAWMLTPKNYCYYPCFRMPVGTRTVHLWWKFWGGSAELCSI